MELNEAMTIQTLEQIAMTGDELRKVCKSDKSDSLKMDIISVGLQQIQVMAAEAIHMLSKGAYL